MAINQLIAQGIAPIGRDLPQIGQMLQQKKQQEQQNALAQIASQTDQQNAESFRRQQDALAAQRESETKSASEQRRIGILSNAYRYVKQNPGAIPATIATLKQRGVLPPEFPDTATIEQLDQMVLGEGAEMPQQPVTLSAQMVGGFNVLRDSTGKVINSQAPERAGSGGGNGPNKQLVTRPTPDGGLQDFAFNPQTSQLEPVGQPYVKTAPLSPRDTTTAKQKLTQISIARRQLQNAKAKFKEIRDSISAGPGGGLLPTPTGRAFDAAIDGMRGTLTALTRVPGVGAMSDYETRLDQAKFPTRNDYEDVIAQKLDQLDALVNGLDTGYRDLLGGASDTSAPSQPSAQEQPQQETTATGPNGQKLVLRNGQWVPL